MCGSVRSFLRTKSPRFVLCLQFVKFCHIPRTRAELIAFTGKSRIYTMTQMVQLLTLNLSQVYITTYYRAMRLYRMPRIPKYIWDCVQVGGKETGRI